jgi:Ca-activated chloride channel homolog
MIQEDTMSLTLAQDRKLVRDTSPCTRYLLATIQAPEQDDAAPRAPLNVAMVIDRSGSMAGEKIIQARQAASYALGLLEPVDRAAVVAYDDIITVLAPSKPISPRARRPSRP